MDKFFNNIKALNTRTLTAYMREYSHEPLSPHVFYMLKSAMEFCDEFNLPCDTFQDLKQVIETFRLMAVGHTLQEFSFVYPEDFIQIKYSETFELLREQRLNVQPVTTPKPCSTCGGGTVR